MKKLISAVVLASALCTVAYAQEKVYEDNNRDANGKIVRGPYEMNKFWDNTFVEVQGGVQFVGACHMGLGNGAKSIKTGGAVDVNLGKWFNPVLGLRLGWQGITGKYMPGKGYGLDGNYTMKYLTNYAHADFLINVSNWWSGYKETRVWDFVPYVTAGYLNYKRTDVTDMAGVGRFGAGVGLYNKIRLTDRLGLSLDLRGVITDNSVLGPDVKSVIVEEGLLNNFTQYAAGYVSAMVGLHVNLGKTGWTRTNLNNVDKQGIAAAALAAGVASAAFMGADDEFPPAKAIDIPSQDKADASLKEAVELQTAAEAVYADACKYVDVNGNVDPAVYEALGADHETAVAYATVANNEACPDFTTMTYSERTKWTKNHKDILPKNWNKMSNDEKNQWVRDNIYTPAEQARAKRDAATDQLDAANQALKVASDDCNQSVADAQRLVDIAGKKVDANGNVLPACYPGVDAATAQRYCDIANSETCPDFTTMTKYNEKKLWDKTHKDILPEGWKKMTDLEKNAWVRDNIWGPAEQAKANKEFADKELERALARKAVADSAYQKAVRPEINDKPVKGQDVESAGYFTIGCSEFNAKQMANFKKAIQDLDKRVDYVVTGYADKETGSAARNAQLRKERSEYVKNLLKQEGFNGVITARPAAENEKFVNTPIWKNRSAVIR